MVIKGNALRHGMAHKPGRHSPVHPAAYRADRPGGVARKDSERVAMTHKGEGAQLRRTG